MDTKHLIKRSEDRLVSFKRMLAEAYKEKYPDWFKEELRDAKNAEMRFLKSIVEEREYEIQGLNPPFCYPEYYK